MGIYFTTTDKSYCSARSASQVRFQGTASNAVTKIVEPSISELVKHAKTPAEKFFLRLESFKSGGRDELVNLFVMAFGTGVVAPLVIYFNKFNKESKDTKKYSAWRQPISAVLSILIQAGINTPLPRIFDRLARRGDLGDKYLGSYRKLHEGDPKFDTADRILKNNYIRARYEEALKKPEYREAVAKLINLLEQQDHAEMVKIASKGRASHPPPLKLLKASQVTIEHAERFAKHNLQQLKYVASFIVSVLLIYPTAVLLNKIYPVFMDKFFPELSQQTRAQKS